MTTTLDTTGPRIGHRLATIDVVIPVHDEEVALGPAVAAVRAHLATLPFGHRVTIADNASTDGTSRLAHALAAEHDDVRVVTLQEKGRGRALKRAWSESDADVLVYMDVDLSTDLKALLPLVAPLVSGHSDIAIGSRLARSSHTTRGPKREIVSRSYNAILRGTLRARFSDAQCGFKAIRRDVAQRLLPLVEDDAWFFDTELLVLAERADLRIHEVPVDWVDDPDSKVDILRTATDDLHGIARLGWSLVRGRVPLGEVSTALGRTTRSSASGRTSAQIAVFALIGVVSTVAYGLLYLLLQRWTGAQSANAIALVVTAVANTAANRRLTFGIVGPRGAARHQLQGLFVLGCGLVITSGSLALLHASTGASHPLVEVVVLTVANLTVTVMRFAAMRWWIFRHPVDRGV
ncbi:MAG: glycosyltransferase [Actinomycetales bacterium]|nr:MAG: glycosyltransferase [Actinomycetales bacterium]